MKSCNYPLPHNSLLAAKPSLANIHEKMTYSRRLGRLWAFIEEQYSDPDIHLEDAAKYCGTSRDHLNILLRRFAEITFHDLLLRYRIEKCLMLLHERNYTLTEIQMRCGFNSPATFGRQFTKWIGCLPSRYKKQFVAGPAAEHDLAI